MRHLTGDGDADRPDRARCRRDERYTYDFKGNSQMLDHILVSPGWQRGHDYDVVHINSEFADQVSDHDPQVVRIRP